MNSHTREIVMMLGLSIILLIIVLDPMDICTSYMNLTFLATLLILLFIALSIFIIREKPSDEREETHLLFAGRAAYLAGMAVMLVGVIVQSFNHMIDVWLICALLVMLLVKRCACLWIEKNQ